jgi:hypothetical protein
MLTLAHAQTVLSQHADAVAIRPQQIKQLLQDVKGVTFANITQVTAVPGIAAAHKAANTIVKVTVANIQLFNNVADYANVYEAAVKRTAAKITDNDVQAIANFKTSENYFKHTDCFSLVQHKTDATKFYLYIIYNNADSLYFINNMPATKQKVAALLQPAAAKKLLEDNNVVYNATNNIMHSVQCRTVALSSIVQIKAVRQSLTVI